jgi:hypothetical protein
MGRMSNIHLMMSDIVILWIVMELHDENGSMSVCDQLIVICVCETFMPTIIQTFITQIKYIIVKTVLDVYDCAIKNIAF